MDFVEDIVVMEETVYSKPKFFKVKSRTRDKDHIVRLMKNGEWRCDCEHFTFRNKSCYHIDYAKTNNIRE
jgi:hypothetical protein